MDLLLIVRGLAAISVVIWHAVGYQNQLPDIFNTPGRTAVWLFFGLSGYVIAYGFIHKRYKLTIGDLKDFYTNRFLRIYPLFLTVSLIVWGTELLVSGISPLDIKDFPAQLFALQFNHSYILSGVFWTLGIEIQFYILAPLLVMPILQNVGRRQLIVIFSLYTCMYCWILFAVTQLGWSYDGRNVISNLPHFFVGMIACQIVTMLKPSKLRLRLSIIGAITLILLTNWLYHQSPKLYWTAGSFLIDLMIFMFILAHASLGRNRFKSNKLYIPFALLGTLSYGIYAWHGYLMKYLPELSDKPLVLIVISVGVAYLSYRFIESPALRLKREKNHSPIESVIK